MAVKYVHPDRFQSALVDRLGWCTDCEDFTTEEVGALEEAVVCDRCGRGTVAGVEEAFRAGSFALGVLLERK